MRAQLAEDGLGGPGGHPQFHVGMEGPIPLEQSREDVPRDHFERAFLMELVLEGLVQNLRIAREDLDSTVTYAELAKFNLMRSRG